MVLCTNKTRILLPLLICSSIMVGMHTSFSFLSQKQRSGLSYHTDSLLHYKSSLEKGLVAVLLLSLEKSDNKNMFSFLTTRVCIKNTSTVPMNLLKHIPTGIFDTSKLYKDRYWRIGKVKFAME
jgi:hypothetical protein